MQRAESQRLARPLRPEESRAQLRTRLTAARISTGPKGFAMQSREDGSARLGYCVNSRARGRSARGPRYSHAAVPATTCRTARSVVLIWSSLLKPDRLSRTAPWGRVPKALWISGAQCMPPAHWTPRCRRSRATSFGSPVATVNATIGSRGERGASPTRWTPGIRRSPRRRMLARRCPWSLYDAADSQDHSRAARSPARSAALGSAAAAPWSAITS